VKGQDQLFSSASDEWSTPDDLWRKLDTEFHFDLDVCASAENFKCSRYFDIATNGLAQPWNCTAAWMNPPYSAIKEWMAKAVHEVECGNAGVVVCLVPARTDTKWWWSTIEWPMVGVDVRFLPGRLRFGTSKNSAPFPSAVLVIGETGTTNMCLWRWKAA
jgi:site-specific DNA-methyltransferase (adenine-specific)